MMQTDLIPRGVTTTLKKLLFWVPVWLLTTLRENLLALRYSIVHIQINKHGSKKKPPPAEEEQGNLGETRTHSSDRFSESAVSLSDL